MLDAREQGHDGVELAVLGLAGLLVLDAREELGCQGQGWPRAQHALSRVKSMIRGTASSESSQTAQRQTLLIGSSSRALEKPEN